MSSIDETIPNILSFDQINSYNDNGYLQVQNFFNEEEKNTIIKMANVVERLTDEQGKWMKYYKVVNGRRILSRVENFLQYLPELESLILNKLTDAVSDLMGERSVIYKDKINLRYPGSNGYPVHQDEPAYVFHNIPLHIVVMISVDSAKKDNGCLQVVPSEHKKGIFDHKDMVIDKKYTDH